MIGQTISHYTISEKLGAGGMGVVYLARDINLERPVAIKFLPQNLAGEADSIERFKREARAAASLNNPNIVTIHEIGEDDVHQGDGRQIFIVMEYIAGCSLREKIAKGPLSPGEVAAINTQICHGLSEAHQAGIVHRDIKPENILIDGKERIKIVDFGLAKLKGVSKLTNELSTVGTLSYMSPEQIQGQEVDQKTDVWSLGILIYEMLTGSVPFKGEYEHAVMYEILNAEPQPITKLVEDLPAQYDYIIKKVLAKTTSERYPDVDHLLYDLKHIDSQSAVQTTSLRAAVDPEKEAIKSLAVLPLADLSRNPEQEYFADGMTEALITELAKLGTLRVISRTSVMRYKIFEKSLPEIARELQVDAVVEGSIIRTDERVRVTAQLIHAATDTHLWAESYERDLRDILFLQSDIARAITHEIQIKLTPQQKQQLANVKPINPQAYEAYLKGRFHWYKLNPQHFDTAKDYFQLAIDLDPDYALPYAGLADILFARSYWSLDCPQDSIPKAKTSALKAIELDDKLQIAHVTLANIKYFYDWDWFGSERAFQHAIKLNPNYADAHLFYSSFLRSMNRPDEAMQEAKMGLDLDPFNFFAQGHSVGHLLFLHQFDEAISQLKKTLQEEPDFTLGHRYLWIAYHQKNMFEEALKEAQNYFSSLKMDTIATALALGNKDSGYAGAMIRAAEEMVTQAKQKYVQPICIARFYAYAGSNVDALKWLEKAYQMRDLVLVNLNTSCDWDGLRNDDNFQNLLARMNFPA